MVVGFVCVCSTWVVVIVPCLYVSHCVVFVCLCCLCCVGFSCLLSGVFVFVVSCVCVLGLFVVCVMYCCCVLCVLYSLSFCCCVMIVLAVVLDV